MLFTKILFNKLPKYKILFKKIIIQLVGIRVYRLKI